jgi:DNA mismatch repair protein MutS2
MKKEMIQFIKENKLSPFEPVGKLRNKRESIFSTSDAKHVYNKTLFKLSSEFKFTDTENLWQCFPFTPQGEEIRKRQEFFSKVALSDNSFLKNLSKPKNFWKPKYGILAVTEDEKTFTELQKLNVPAQFISSQYDLDGLENYDIVQVIDCDNFSSALESLPQSVFLDSVDDVYLERYLEILSGWQKNFDILSKSSTNAQISSIVQELMPLLKLLEDNQVQKISKTHVEASLEKINEKIEQEISNMNISGTVLMSMLSKGTLPPELLSVVERSIKESNLPSSLFKEAIPVSIDEQELDKTIKEQNANEHTKLAETVKKYSTQLRKIPVQLQELSDLLVYYDFICGISKMIIGNNSFPQESDDFYFSEAENVFLDDAQPITFLLNGIERCSILTGANSGGKTTLLEHVIQLITFFQLGLPVKGSVKLPIFSDVYYFAKNKGSASKGAFETLLTQMSSIKPGAKTLILADEIEAVTEPGVAGKIISATADFFVNKGCFLIIATHLGQEIQKKMPQLSRIDGIEARGLDENFELLVDHNPVLGKLASSTPELIIEKMASLRDEEYFQFLLERVSSKNNLG